MIMTEKCTTGKTVNCRARTALADTLFAGAARLSASIVFMTIAAILISLIIGAAPAFHKFGFGFITSSDWNPVTEDFGARSAIFGTLISSGLAMMLGLPVSFGIALFITEICPQFLKRPVKTAVELLAAIPSIIYGMWGLFVFAPVFGDNVQPWLTEHTESIPLIGPLFDGPPMGIGMATAGIILGIMIIPFITSVMCELFEAVPQVLKESAYGTGATTWEVFRRIVLPYTKVGIVGGVMLGLGRALGETMAVTFVIGNADRICASLFMPGNTISSSLANQFTEADSPIYTSSLIALGLILFVITFTVLAAAKLLLMRINRNQGER
jgi:phosphate transport system permease protein